MRLHVFHLLSIATAAGAFNLDRWSNLSPTPQTGALRLANATVSPTFLLDAKEWNCVARCARDVAQDFGRVLPNNGTVKYVNTTSASLNTPVIIAGTIGSSPDLVDKLISAGKIDVSAIKGKWETWTTTIVSQPYPGVDKALVVVGSTKRGTIYGLYDLSEQIGVSPFYWFTDVPPKKQKEVYALATTKITKEPTVQYRGFFINDEAPALSGWINENYPRSNVTGRPGYTAQFYSHVFELLLRLKANYMWPTTWDSEFYVDDAQNGPTADYYGITMGTSHTEPMTRQSEEQESLLKGGWDWLDNQPAVKDFMKEGVVRTKEWDTLYTLGMRGLGDVASPTLNETVEEEIVKWQRETLQTVLGKNITDIAQLIVLFDELGSYYQYGMRLPDDLPVLFPDDNTGNLMRLPIANDSARSGGAGIYYHLDMNAPPRNYKWINSIQLIKSWHQLSLAVAKGAHKIWVFNVGDIKPLEIPFSHVFEMAWDITQFSTVQSTGEWLARFGALNYGEGVADATNKIMTEYGRLIIRRKYEQLSTTPFAFNVVNYDECERNVNDWLSLLPIAQTAYDSLDAATQPSFFEVVLHPVLAGSTVENLYAKYTFNQLYSKQKRVSTNIMATAVKTLFAQDASITQRFHTLLNGKWNHMMDQVHIGYTSWNDPATNIMPDPAYISANGSAAIGVAVQGSSNSIAAGGSITSDSVSPYQGPEDKRWFEIFAMQNMTSDYTITSNSSFIKLSRTSGTIKAPSTNLNDTDHRIYIDVDWSAAPSGTTKAVLTISGSKFPRTKVTVPVSKPSLPDTFTGHVESNGAVAIEAEHYQRSKDATNPAATWQLIPHYGRTLSGMHTLPLNGASQSDSSAPYLEYDFYTLSSAKSANVTVYIGPTMNVDQTRPIKYTISVDGGAAKTVSPVPEYVLGPPSSNWKNAIEGAWSTKTTVGDLAAGKHTIRISVLEPNLVLERLAIDVGGLKASYLGPPESAYVKNGKVATFGS